MQNISVLVQDRGLIYSAIRDFTEENNEDIEGVKDKISEYIVNNININKDQNKITIYI